MRARDGVGDLGQADFKEIPSRRRGRGPWRVAVLLNAAAALVAHAGLSGEGDEPLVALIGAAFGRAQEAVDSGEAAAVLDRWIADADFWVRRAALRVRSVGPGGADSRWGATVGCATGPRCPTPSRA